jgi:hypothetical protein
MSNKKYLSQFTKEQLIEQIIELASKYKDVKQYYSFHQNPDSENQKEVFKATIYKAFFNRSVAKLKDARKAVNDFKKLSPIPEALASLMLYFVECGTKYAQSYGTMTEAFYTSLENMFSDTCIFIVKNNLEIEFQPQCKLIIELSTKNYWVFHRNLLECYDDCFEN